MSKKVYSYKYDSNKDKYIKDKECKLPFIYKNKVYNDCFNTKKGKICATEVDDGMKMTKYGLCLPVKQSNKQSNKQTKKNSPKSKSSPSNKKSKSPKKSSPSNKKTKKRIVVKKRLITDTKVFGSLDTLDIQNLKSVIVPEELMKYMRPKTDRLDIKLWENPTRKNFLNWYDKTYKDYRITGQPKKITVTCDEKECEQEIVEKKIDLFTHQKVVRDYINDNSPYRGLLVYHGLGVGKTCSSIAISEGFDTSRKIVVLLQKSIKQNYISQLKFCGDLYYRNQNHWEFIKMNEKNKPKINLALKMGIPKRIIKKFNGCFLIDFSKPKPNYDSLLRLQKEKLEEQIDAMINSKYEFVHTNGLTTNQLDKMESSNYFDNKVVIIDEVHNIINGMASGGSMRAMRLNELFMNAENLKLIFLSGTPMKNTPFEIAKLYNVLAGYLPVFEMKVDRGQGSNFQTLEKELRKNRLIDQIIPIQKYKTVKVTRNPFGFIRSNNNKGIEKNEDNLISTEEFIEQLHENVEKAGYKIKTLNVKNTTLFPDNNKDFTELFYDPIKNRIKNVEMFKRRILGLTSFYSSAKKELVPEIRSKEVLFVPMSDYMFDKYSIVRKSEIDRDKKSKSKAKKGKDGENIFEVNSSYRAYSRMLCQFVFPEEIERPFKGDLKDLEVPDEEMDRLEELQKEYQEKIDKEKSRNRISELKEELRDKIKELKKTDQEYEKRLHKALNDLDDNRMKYLVYDNGNKDKLTKYSPKYAKIVEQVIRDKNKNNKGLKFIYTEYKTSEGVGILSKVLRANGYSPFRVKRDIYGEWELDFIEGEEHLPKYAVWSGDEESDIILRIYNDLLHLLPDKIRSEVEEISKTNRNGQLLEILMTTKQGAEGLNTRNVRQLHIVEPYWNPVRLDQVVGRAVRIGSHLELPPKDRNVDIYIYLSKATTPQLKKNITMTNDFKGKTSDEVLYDIAERKREIMDILLGIMKDSAIDCSLNIKDNIKTNPGIKCINFGSIKDQDSYSFTADISDELKESERKTRVEKTQETYKTLQITIGGEKRKVALSTSNNKIYDYNAVESGRPGDPIGEIVTNKDGKKKIKFF